MNAKGTLLISTALCAGLLTGQVWRHYSRDDSLFDAIRAVQGHMTWPVNPPAGLTKPQSTGHSPEESKGLASLPQWRSALSPEENELAIYEALGAATPEQLTAWLERDYRVPPVYSASMEARAWEATQKALLDRLLDTSPASFARWVSRMPSGYLRDPWIGDAVRELRTRPGGENAEATAVLKAAFPKQFEMAVLLLLAESDPAAALEQWKGESYAFPTVCADFLAADPGRALAYVAKQPGVLPAVTAALRRLGPEALESFAEKLPGPPEETRSAWAIVALDKARELQPGGGAAFAAFLKERGVRDFPPDAFAGLPAGVAGEIMTSLKGEPELQSRVLTALASSDPAEAARLFAQSPETAAAILKLPGENGYSHNPFVRQLTDSWMFQDPKALREWASTLPPELLTGVISEVSTGLSGQQFMDTTRGAPLPEDPQRLDWLGAAAAREAEDTAGLMDWLGSFPPAIQEKLSVAMAGTLAARDPYAAAALAAGQADLQKREQLIRAVGGSADFQSPAAVLQWGMELPADLRVSGLTAAFGQMAFTYSGVPAADLSRAAADLINAQPPETFPAWGQLASEMVRRVGPADLPQAEVFWTSLPETVREASQQAFGYALGEYFYEGTDPMEAVVQLRLIRDGSLRRRIADQLREAVPGLSQFTQAQAESLTAQLKELSR